MAVQKFLGLVAGKITEIVALVTSSGAADAGKLVALDAAGKLDQSFMPTGIGAETKTLPTSENLAAGDLVNIYDNTGTLTARKADATTEGKEAHGFVLASTTSPANAVVYMAGIITGLSGLTGGPRMYLATTAGGVTATAPSTAGNIVQCVGQRLSATELAFDKESPITLA